MVRLSSGMILVENFLCFISLRAGTLFSLYLTLMSSFYFALVILNATIVSWWDSSFAPAPMHLYLIEIAMIALILALCFTLLHFPVINKKYNEDSVNAKCLKYLFGFYAVMSVIGILVTFGVIAIGGPWNSDRLPAIIFLTALWTSVFVHFTAVAYSYHLSILQSQENPGDATAHNIEDGDGSTQKIIRKDFSCSSNDGKLAMPLPQSSNSSTNGSGNLYVELR
ncbi:uncharacterized protein LOC135836826 [Planococcus citri]|uniref:uncharacterized protein LOC135836826 n=1 Tax=Planococcus citri TaxID=170843 RepID=UPI0031FA3AF5